MKNVNFVIRIIRLVLLLACIGPMARGIQIGITDHEFIGSYFIKAFTALLSLAITHIPDFLRQANVVVMPAVLQMVFTVFSFLAMFLGEILHFYERFAWWDSMLHFTSGIMFSLIGYMLFVSLNRDSGIRGQLHPASVVLFALCFSIACGAVWEIFEFSADSLLGLNMQRWQNGMPPEQWAVVQNVSNASSPGLLDTMKDIINDSAGTLLAIPVLLPLVRRNNRYIKKNITPEELLEEALPKKRRPAEAPVACEVNIQHSVVEKTA